MVFHLTITPILVVFEFSTPINNIKDFGVYYTSIIFIVHIQRASIEGIF